MRFEIHIESPTADIQSTIYKSRAFVEQLVECQFCIDIVQATLRALKEELEIFKHRGRRFAARSTESKENIQGSDNDHVTTMWDRNLMRQLYVIERKLKDLIEGQRATETMVKFPTGLTSLVNTHRPEIELTQTRFFPI